MKNIKIGEILLEGIETPHKIMTKGFRGIKLTR